MEGRTNSGDIDNIYGGRFGGLLFLAFTSKDYSSVSRPNPLRPHGFRSRSGSLAIFTANPARLVELLIVAAPL